jgi:hypothetical protein
MPTSLVSLYQLHCLKSCSEIKRKDEKSDSAKILSTESVLLNLIEDVTSFYYGSL